MDETLSRAGQAPGRLLWSAIRGIGRRLSKSFALAIVAILFLVLLGSAIGVYYTEQGIAGGISSVGEALWWMVVTVTTVGYGDFTPISVPGRIIAVILIIIGVALIPIMTAFVASYMVTRRLRRERGLEEIPASHHTILCGWNEHIDEVIDGLAATDKHPDIVLVNSLPVEDMDQMLLRHKSIKLRFVHGDFTSETILDLANVRQAASVVILTDVAQGGISGADERAVLATLAVRTMNPKARVCTEVTQPRAASHVRRAGASEVIIHGEYDPFLITSAATAKGIVLATRQLLSYRDGSCLRQQAIPPEFRGKTFAELSAHFREKHRAILVGLVSLGESMRPEDVLSGDESLIDAFIERKFKEAGKEYLASQFETPQANLNPGDEYVVRQNEVAIVVA